MFSLLPLPYRIIAGIVLLASLFGLGFYGGSRWQKTVSDAAETQAVKEAAKKLDLANQRADGLSNQLSKAEAQVITKTVEVIKYVPKVTTGRLCLDSDAVRVLNTPSNPDVPEAPSKPAPESLPVAPASDRDVAYWIAGANQQYETCAVRLNALIDFYQP
jgi:prophage endopeptidase